MAEIGLAASVAGLISLGIQTAQTLVEFYSAYKNQKSEVKEIITRLDRLCGMLEDLRSLTAREFRADEKSLLDSIEKLVPDCEEVIHELQEEAQKFVVKPADSLAAKARATVHKAAYPFRQSTLLKLEESIQVAISHLSLALQMLQQKTIDHIQNDMDDTKILLQLVRSDQASQKIRRWLNAPDATINYNETYKNWQPGTGNWLVKGPLFQCWLVQPSSILWLKGFAGCGKSVLCSTAIRHSFRHRRSSPRIGLAFFFFTFNDATKQSASAMIRALILQLSGQLNDNCSAISVLKSSYSDATPPDSVLVDCLHKLVHAFDDVYILLDALDESPSGRCRDDVLQTLVNVRAWSEPGLHILLTSRDEADIREVLRDELCLTPDSIISLNGQEVDEDIRMFVSGYLKSSRKMQNWKLYHEQIETALVEKANGMCVFLQLPLSLGTSSNLLGFGGLSANLKH